MSRTEDRYCEEHGMWKFKNMNGDIVCPICEADL